MVENWSKLHLLWRILGCLLSHLLCRRFSGAACRQAQRRREFNIYALKGFWEVSAGVSCLGFGVWSRGYGLPWLPGSVVSWGESVAFFSWGPKAPLSSGWLFADVCLWRVGVLRVGLLGGALNIFLFWWGMPIWVLFTVYVFSGCGVSLRVLVIFVCVFV